MKACFIGHRTIENNKEIISSLKYTIIALINKGVTTFLFGSKSEFDDLSWKIVTELKEEYPSIKRVYVRSSHRHINKSYEEYLHRSYESTYFPDKLEKIAYEYAIKKKNEIIDLYK